MSETLNIHPDFKALKAIPTPTKRWVLALMNGFLATLNAIKCIKLKAILTQKKIPGLDGHLIPLLIIRPENLSSPSAADAPRYASPRHGDLSGLAPAYVETAEFDPLHDEGIDYASALLTHGVEVELNETQKTVHGYDLVVPNSEISKAAIDRRNQFLRKVFQS